jgi:FMN reductase
MTIVLLACSPSIPSRSARLLRHVGERLALPGHRYSKLHVLDLPAASLLQADFNNADIKAAKAQVEEADVAPADIVMSVITTGSIKDPGLIPGIEVVALAKVTAVSIAKL